MKEFVLDMEEGPFIEEVLPALAKCRHLRNLTLRVDERDIPSSEVWCDFIIGMKHLTYLRLFPNPHLKPLRDRVNEFVLLRRSNFDFDLSTDV